MRTSLNNFQRATFQCLCTLTFFLGWTQVACAHVEGGQAAGFITGLQHPWSGLDHVLAMIAVGLWGAQLGSPAIWLLPIAFPMMMALGAMMGLIGIPVPGVEIGIALSAILLGTMILAEVKPKLAGRQTCPSRSRHLYRRNGAIFPLEFPDMTRPRSITKFRDGLLAVFTSLFCLPSYASAHLVTTGLGPVYDGIGHLVMTPEDLIPVLALALLAGLRGTRPGRHALFLLPLAWFAGGIIGVSIAGMPTISFAAVSIFILGLLVAADLKISNSVFQPLCLLWALVVGF